MRRTMQIVTFLVLLNAAAGVVTASGLGADMGINPAIGGDERIDSARNEASTVQPSGGSGSTLFTLYTSVTGFIETLGTIVFYGPAMLHNLGIPMWFLQFLFAPAFLIVGRDVVYALSGRSL